MTGTIVNRVNEVIQTKGYKQYVIAERAGFKPKDFSDLMNGRKTFKAEYIMPICYALDVTPNVLFGFEEIPNKPPTHD